MDSDARQESICPWCQSRFTKKYGHQKSCSDLCRRRKAQSEYRKKFPNASTEYHKNADPKWAIVKRAKQSARRKKLEFNLTEDDLEIPEVCPVFGFKLIYCNNGYRKDDSMSIDRVDNSRGYTAGNIRIISWKANRLKSNATIDELKKIITYMEEIQNGR